MRNINELIGIINGISYDGIINKLEVARLSSWVKKNRNLSYEHKQAHLISLVEQVLEDCEMQRIKDWTTIKQNVRDALGKFFYDKTRRRPMILPIIQDV